MALVTVTVLKLPWARMLLASLVMFSWETRFLPHPSASSPYPSSPWLLAENFASHFTEDTSLGSEVPLLCSKSLPRHPPPPSLLGRPCRMPLVPVSPGFYFLLGHPHSPTTCSGLSHLTTSISMACLYSSYGPISLLLSTINAL